MKYSRLAQTWSFNKLGEPLLKVDIVRHLYWFSNAHFIADVPVIVNFMRLKIVFTMSFSWFLFD